MTAARSRAGKARLPLLLRRLRGLPDLGGAAARRAASLLGVMMGFVVPLTVVTLVV